MTNRQWIEQHHRIPAAIAALIQPSFSFDVSAIPIIPDYIRGGWEWLMRVVSTVSFIRGVSHELEHIRQQRELGLRWYLRIAGDVVRSLIRAHRWYSHDLSRNEQEALRKEWDVWLRLEPTYETWRRLLERDTEE